MLTIKSREIFHPKSPARAPTRAHMRAKCSQRSTKISKDNANAQIMQQSASNIAKNNENLWQIVENRLAKTPSRLPTPNETKRDANGQSPFVMNNPKRMVQKLSEPTKKRYLVRKMKKNKLALLFLAEGGLALLFLCVNIATKTQQTNPNKRPLGPTCTKTNPKTRPKPFKNAYQSSFHTCVALW